MEVKKSDGFHIMVLPTSSIPIRIWVEFLIGQFILEVTFSIRLGTMRWVPTALDCFNGPRLAAVGPSGGFVLMATIGQGYAMKDRLWLAIQSVAK